MEEQYILENAKRDSEGRLLAPNGKPSNLTEKQYVQVRTKAFKDWFGDWEKEYTPQTNIYKENPYKSIFDKYIINKGHDGAISGTRDFTKERPSNALEAKEIVVTYPNQIKSATDNEGGFSRTNDNIYKRHGEDRDRHLYSRERAVKYIKDQGYTIDNLVHDTYETRFEVTLKAKVKEDIWR
jgi:hypothetical protein